MSFQSSFEKQSISPITGLLRERHGRNDHQCRRGWLYEDTRHYWRRGKEKRAKNITLRTHRMGY